MKYLIIICLLAMCSSSQNVWKVEKNEYITLSHTIGYSNYKELWVADSTGPKMLGFRLTDHIRYEDNVYYVWQEGEFVHIVTDHGEIPPIKADRLVSIEYAKDTKNNYWVNEDSPCD